MNDIITLNYGSEDDVFHMQHVKRTEPFERKYHDHGSYEIYYLRSGQRTYFNKDRSYLIAAGDLLFINKFEVHNTSVNGPPEHERILINFSDALINMDDSLFQPYLFTAFTHSSGVFRLSLQEQHFVEAIFSKLAQELTEKANGYELYIKLLLIELLLYVSRLSGKEDRSIFESTRPQHRILSEIVQYINLNFASPLSLELLAKHFYSSPFYISRSFKLVTGVTFIQYLTTTRIREAQKLLLDPKLKIIAIAGQVGFEDSSHFGRTFKQLTGTSPLQYRKKMQASNQQKKQP